MSYRDYWNRYADYHARYQLQTKLANPNFRKQFRMQQESEAERLIQENLLSYDGESWRVYPKEYHVKKRGKCYVCSCELFKMLGYCSHTLAVARKENGVE